MSLDLGDVIKKCNDVDKDFRITAITDLTEELKKEAFTMDAASESKIVENVLRLLQDSAKEVQDVAVKSLGPLVRKVSEQHVTNIVNQLAENIANTKRGKEEVREVSNSGLKAVLRDVDERLGERISGLLAPGLIKAVKLDSQDVQQECLDVINDLLARFGSATSPKYLNEIQDVTLPLLASSRNLIKQRAIWVLTNVGRYCPEAAFQTLSDALLKRMGGEIKKQSTTIQLVGSIARNVGFRMGRHVNAFVPLLAAAVSKSSADGDEDIKENAFQTFASFVESCPRDIRPHIDAVMALCLKFLSWDPNQLEDSGDEGSGAAGSDGEDEEGSDSGMEASEDEDDKTWMVRRAAAKTITSLVVNHPERLAEVCDKAGPELVKQFKERESTARHEILGTYEALAAACEHAGKASPASEAFLRTTDKALSALALLLQHKSADTRLAAAVVLRSLVRSAAAGAAVGAHLKQLVPGIGAALGDSNPALRVTALGLTRDVLLGCPAEVVPHLDALFAPLQKVLADRALHSRVASAALEACEAILVAGAGNVPFLTRVYTALEPLYRQTDLDAEAKEAAIRAAARAICNLGSRLPSLNAALDVLVERLGSELTREAAANAVATIAESGEALGDVYLVKAVPLLCSFCAPGARSLKIAALTALAAVFSHYGEGLKTHAQVLADVAQLIDAEDLTLTQLAVTAAVAVVHSNPKSVPDVKKSVYGRVLPLLASPLLEGASLAAIGALYSELTLLQTKGFGFAELVKDIEGQFKQAYQTKDHHVYRNLASCFAQAVVSNSDQKQAGAVVQGLVKQAASKDEEERIGAMYVLAEVGRHKDVSEYAGLVEALSAGLDSPARSVALAASYGLGSVATGNLSQFLPLLLDDMAKNPKRQLLLLQAIKEIVSGQSASSALRLSLSLSSSLGGTAAQDIAVHLDTLLPILFQHAAAQDDLTRNAVSECLGRLAKIAPERIVSELAKRATDKSAFARACMVNALRYALSEKPSAELDALLQKAFAAAAAAIGDADILVRLAGMQAVTWALQTKPRVVKDHLVAALPALYKETVVDQSLIKIIDLGQIKHVTDHGLDKRTAAYELLYVLLETAFDAVSIADYLDPILRAQEDVLTIKEASFKILRRMAVVAGGQLYALLDKVLPVLEKEVKRPIPKSEPGERILVMKRACLSAIIALGAIANAGSHAKLQELLSKTIPACPFKDEYTELVKASSKK